MATAMKTDVDKAQVMAFLREYRDAEREYYSLQRQAQVVRDDPKELAFACMYASLDEVAGRERCGRAQVRYENARGVNSNVPTN